MKNARTARSSWIFGLALAAAVATYWTGLGGPYLLDDFVTLSAIDHWQAGQQSWQMTLLPNSNSFVFSRPVSMASFMLSSWLGGPGTFPLKLGNLVVHLLCGYLAWSLLRRIFAIDSKLANHANLYAAIAVALWLLHPLHVSTVLYAVQRMAQLAALFTLAAVSVYLIARQQLSDGRLRPAAINLFVSFPILLALGVLSKQNAAIAPFACLVLELAYLRPAANRGPGWLAVFFVLFVVVPMLAVVALLSLAPERLLAGYAEWDFTLWQRLLTQPRALLDYVGMWFVPRGPQMGLYTDAYPVSTSVLSPPSTLLAIVALVFVSAFAIAVRKRAASVFAGWFFFLVTHAVESSFLPLEMYYEHRNYLPAFGLLIATFGLATLIPAKLRPRGLNSGKIAAFAVVALALVLTFATFSRVLVWKSEDVIIAQGMEQNPRSLRARLDLASVAFRADDYARAKTINEPLLRSSDPRDRVVGNLQAVVIACMDDDRADPDNLKTAVTNARPKLTASELRLVRTMFNLTRDRTCQGVDNETLGDTVSSLAMLATGQSEGSPAKYVTRSFASQFYARAGAWDKAEDQAKLAWDASQHPPNAALLARIYLQNGKTAEARTLVKILADRVEAYNGPGQAEINALDRMLMDVDGDTGSTASDPAR